MSNTGDESRLKEVVKAAIIEVLEERRDLWRNVATESGNSPQAQLLSPTLTLSASRGPAISSTVKVILLWVVLLMSMVLVYQLATLRH
jgi:hypothetical protein